MYRGGSAASTSVRIIGVVRKVLRIFLSAMFWRDWSWCFTNAFFLQYTWHPKSAILVMHAMYNCRIASGESPLSVLASLHSLKKADRALAVWVEACSLKLRRLSK